MKQMQQVINIKMSAEGFNYANVKQLVDFMKIYKKYEMISGFGELLLPPPQPYKYLVHEVADDPAAVEVVKEVEDILEILALAK